MNALSYRIMIVLLLGMPAAIRAQTPHLDALRQKNLGVAYLEQRQIPAAEAAFRKVVQLQPDEALGYVNLAMCCLRSGRLDEARLWAERARQRAPRNPEILLRAAEVLLSSGDLSQAVGLFESVLEVEPKNLMAHYGIVVALASGNEDPAARRRVAQHVQSLYEIAPSNLAIAVRAALEAVQSGNSAGAQGILRDVAPLVDDLTSVRDVYSKSLEAVRANRSDAVNQLRRLTNSLTPTARYRQALAELQPPIMGIPVEWFSAPFYTALQRERPLPGGTTFRPFEVRQWPLPLHDRSPLLRGALDAADIDRDGRDDVLAGLETDDGGGLYIWLTSTSRWTAVTAEADPTRYLAARFFDYDNDGTFEIVATGRDKTCLLEHAEDGWHDITAQANLRDEPGQALELLDADNEGDLDLCLSTSGVLRLWQNRGDGSFRFVEQRSGLAAAGGGVRQVVALDYDDDLDTDLCLVDVNRRLQMFTNLRHGRFQRVKCGLDQAQIAQLLVADFDNDGREDLLEVFRDGVVKWQPNAENGFLPGVGVADLANADHVTVLDLDNDQWLDVVAAVHADGQRQIVICANRGDGTWYRQATLPYDQPLVAMTYAEVNRDGALDLLTLHANGQLNIWQNRTGTEGGWLRVELRGLNRGGSKNNLYGIGCKVEIKSGANYQARFVRRPVTHFGLAAKPRADVLRVIWSNGVPQNQFQPAANQTIREVQVLKGSCPYLYSWDGERFVFVTDLLAAAPLGLRPAEGLLAPDNPRELMTVPRHQVAQRDGQFVFQFTSELWETVYLDEVSLWVVDHPSHIAVFTDQRFRPPPYDRPAPILTGERVVPRRALDSTGQNVVKQVRHFDYRYPERLVPSAYQGIVQPHQLTLEFGNVSQLDHPLLVLGCWIFWTDTSINVAASQARRPLAQPPILESWDPARNKWTRVDLPFWLPTGKNKWVVLDVSRAVSRDDARLRLRTSHQIYWDQAFLVNARPDAAHRVTTLQPEHADLHFGGFHRLYRPAPDGPHLYDYSQSTRLPLWMTMSGMATRYGNVTELLRAGDDCMVIFTGGDEVTIRFPATSLPELPPGWVRDFLFYSDGWEKDSDRNTLTGETVTPLPFHGMSSYPYPAGESYPDDPFHEAYRKHYNTRPIGPEAFRHYLKEFRPSAADRVPWVNEPHVRGDNSK